MTRLIQIKKKEKKSGFFSTSPKNIKYLLKF